MRLFSFNTVLFGLWIVNCCLVPLSLMTEPTTITSAPCSAELLLDKLYAVHATRHLPEAGYIRAGWAFDESDAMYQTLLPKVRKTLHFSLGELVRPVDDFMSWEDCPYALVTTVRNLLPQLINLNCYDTFILGDLKLSSDTYLIVPIEIAQTIKTRATIIPYDSQTKSLREAVDAFILSKGGWHIEMDSKDIEDELHSAYLDGRNINTADFFGPLTERRSWLSVGLRFDPCDGEHYRLSHIERSILVLTMQLLSNGEQEKPDFNELDSAQLGELIHIVNEHFEKWSQTLVGFNWCPESRQAYQQIITEIKKWECLVYEELRLRSLYGKTLIKAPPSLLLECAALLDQPEVLQAFMDQHINQLSCYPIN